MVFQKDDIYTSSGSVRLYNSWTPYVSKFDTSSFYNWEQDNLPLYDVEERTYENWEQAGFATSSLPGFALTVSADTPPATLQANSNIFTQLSSCIAAIPKVVRFPVLIEVCNFGEMGPLELHNFRIEEGGSIEIINRAYSKVYNASAFVEGIATNPVYNQFNNLPKRITSTDVSATLLNDTPNLSTSSVNIATPVFSGTQAQFGGSTALSNGMGDPRVSSVYSCLYPRNNDRKAPLAVAIKRDNFIKGTGITTINTFMVNPYEGQATVDLTLGGHGAAAPGIVSSFDISSYNPWNGDIVQRTPIDAGATHRVGGSIYLNSLSKLSIKNCDGPIFVRNFIVDGNNQLVPTTPALAQDVGINIINSDVVLENCAAVRCNKAGFKFNNSKVVLSRSAFAYRNYELSTATSRVADIGVGFHAVNSDVSISALVGLDGEGPRPAGAGDYQGSGCDVIICASRNTVGIQLDNSRLTGGVTRRLGGIGNLSSGGITTSEFNTGQGITLNNSYVNIDGLLDVCNNDVGIDLNNSQLKYQQLCADYNNTVGFRANNSHSTLMDSLSGIAQTTRRQIDFSGNGQHIDLENQSKFTFEKSKNSLPTLFGNTFIASALGRQSPGFPIATPAISISDNSKADFINLKLTPRTAANLTANMPQYGLGVAVTKNSEADFYGTKNGATFILGPSTYGTQQYTAGVYAGDNSVVGFHGPTFIGRFGIDVLAENHSTINMMPPTIKNTFLADVSGFDLSDGTNHTSVELHSTRACLVANKNSTLNLENLGSFDSSWPRSPQGIQAYSVIDTDFKRVYGSDLALSTVCGFGSLQFFPNPQNSVGITSNELDSLEAQAFPIYGTTPTFAANTAGRSNQFLISDAMIAGTDWPTSMLNASRGGVCVRATDNSVVNVTNVTFPVGTNDGAMDGVIYNASGTDCDRLMIWNIADTSRFNAAYCSVSGMYPADVGYHGPSAVWASSVSKTGGAGTWVSDGAIPASGAPSSTPDTGVLSILDAFGAGSSTWCVPSGVTINMPFRRFASNTTDPWNGTTAPGNTFWKVDAGIALSGGNGHGSPGDVFEGCVTPGIWGSAIESYNNQGVFRLYFSPKSECKLLQNDASGYLFGANHGGPGEGGAGTGRTFSGVVGPAYQVFAQCYNMSAPLSAVGNDATLSGLYPNLLKLSEDSDGDGIYDKLWTSGFYYCEEFVEDRPSQCMIDESAANTFANAKNASIGMAGRPRRVTLYRARKDKEANPGAEAYEGTNSTYPTLNPRGFKSANIFDLKRDN